MGELTDELEIRRAEEADQLAVWDSAQFQLPGMTDDVDEVSDLITWEGRVTASTADKPAKKHA